jgi:hypothetical protein
MACLRHRAHNNNSEPASRNREPFCRNGGRLTSASLIPRYVEPQMNHVAARHAAMRGERVVTDAKA